MRSRVFKLIRKEQWSSARVSRWLRRSEGRSGSKSAIYNWIAGGSPHYKDSIHKHLRRGGKKSENSAQGSRIPNRVSVDERPAEANGQTLGNREMDTIVGKDGKGAIVTLVERKSSFMLMEKLNTGKQAIPTADAVVRLLKGYRLSVRTITTDNGRSSQHTKLSKGNRTREFTSHIRIPHGKKGQSKTRKDSSDSTFQRKQTSRELQGDMSEWLSINLTTDQGRNMDL